jgi:hypothetical protein
LVSTCLALPAATLPMVLNSRAPGRDTLQSWTCGWVETSDEGMPGDFGRVCGESVSLLPFPFILQRQWSEDGFVVPARKVLERTTTTSTFSLAKNQLLTYHRTIAPSNLRTPSDPLPAPRDSSFGTAGDA